MANETQVWFLHLEEEERSPLNQVEMTSISKKYNES